MVHQDVEITPRQGAAYICSEESGEEVLAGIAISEPLTKTKTDYIGEWIFLWTLLESTTEIGI